MNADYGVIKHDNHSKMAICLKYYTVHHQKNGFSLILITSRTK